MKGKSRVFFSITIREKADVIEGIASYEPVEHLQGLHWDVHRQQVA